MLHQVSGGTHGTASDVEHTVEFIYEFIDFTRGTNSKYHTFYQLGVSLRFLLDEVSILLMRAYFLYDENLYGIWYYQR